MARSPKLAVWKFASCDGCQLSLLDCEDELLALAGEVDIAYFLEASSAPVGPVRPLARRGLDHHAAGRRAHPRGPRAVAARGHDRRVRDGGRHPGAAQLRRRRGLRRRRLRDARVHLDARDSTAISEHVQVDYELQGCPIDKRQLLEVISAFLNERRPAIAAHSVCVECKRAGNVCVMVAHGTPCLGPVTHAGCGALCPSYHRGCYGCFGPMEAPTAGSLARGSRASAWRRDLVRCTGRSTRRRSAPRRACDAETRTITTDALARVEGEGAMSRASATARVEDVRLRIYEPPRFFEAFLRGRAYTRAGRHHRAHLRDLPRRLPDERVRGDRGRLRRRGPRRDPRPAPAPLLRRVDREPRAARVHAPRPRLPRLRQRVRDGARPPRVVEQGLQIKKAGNALMRVVGGREIHPVNVRVGGFYRAPRRRELRALVEELEAAREFALETVACTAASTVPDFERALRVRRAVDAGPLPARGRPAGVDRRARHRPRRVRGALRRGAGPALDGAALAAARARRLPVGPLARYALNSREALAARARGGRRGRPRPVCRNPFRSIVVRSVEILYALDEALRLIAAYEEPDPPAVDVPPRAGTGYGWTEAPRGLLLAPLRARRGGHDPRREDRPADLAEPGLDRGRPARLRGRQPRARRRRLRHLCEQAIRNYDPCISCATHFLTLEVERLSDTLVIGLGNSWRGDDGAGPAVARELLDEVRARARVRGRAGGADRGLDGRRRGDRRRRRQLRRAAGDDPPARPARRADPRRAVAGSTHAFGLAETIELARALDRLPARVTVYGIEGERFTAGEELSQPVRAAVEQVGLELRERLGKSAAGGRQAPDGEPPAQT